MIRLYCISDPTNCINVAKDDASAFVKWLLNYFQLGKYLDKFAVNAVMNNFDSLERDNCIFRASLQTWLWQAQSNTVSVEQDELELTEQILPS